MKKFDVCFSSQIKGKQSERSQIDANSSKEAFHKFLDGKTPNDYEVVVVSAASFFESIRTLPESFPNPLYKPNETPKSATDEVHAADFNLNYENSYSTSISYLKTHSVKLDKLIELQEKQLFWIRFFGVITVISMVIAFFYVILVMNSGYRRY